MVNETLLLSKKMVKQCITMEDAINIVEQAFKAHGLVNAAMPAKITLNIGDTGNWSNAMPAYVKEFKSYGIKWAGGFIDNPKRENLPYIMAEFILNDPETGAPLAIMEASVITAMRTGASVAVGAKYLACKHSSVVAIVGTGVQGRTSLEALHVLFDIKEARVADISKEALEKYSAEMGEQLGLSIRPVDSVKEAVTDADIIVTVTTANKPLVMNGWVKPGAYIASMGSFPELDRELVLQADKIVVDSFAQSKHRGELVPLFEEGKLMEVYGELGDIIIGKKMGRINDHERIVACLIGMATEDLGIASKLFARAKEKGLGQKFTFLD